MLATLYELEVIEEKAVSDWKSPPDNRHLFLFEAKKAFDQNQVIEATKQAKQFITWLETEQEEP